MIIITILILLLVYYIIVRDPMDSLVGGSDDVNLNPTLQIVPVSMTDGRKFNIIRDDFLPGGTKQRIMGDLLSNSSATEFVYAGPSFGYAQVALSFVAKHLGKKATLFIEKQKPMTSLTRRAKEYGATVHEISDRGRPALLKVVQERAGEYVEKIKKDKSILCNHYIELIPFGLYTPEFIESLAKQIKNALPTELIDKPPGKIWLAAGSATILNALYKVFPNTEFGIVQVGKTIWPDQIDEARTTKYVSDQKFWEVAKIQPPYPTVKTYDAKIWKYVMEYGKSGDYVWNVGKD